MSDEEVMSEEAAASQEDSLLAGSEAAESGSDAGQDSDVSMADAEAADAAAATEAADSGAADSEGDLAEPGTLDTADPVLQCLLSDVQLACQLTKLASPGRCAASEGLRCVAVQLHVMWCMSVGLRTLTLPLINLTIPHIQGQRPLIGCPQWASHLYLQSCTF